MATVTLGNIKLNWKGAYNAGTAYAIDDVVSYNGSSYVAKTATTGNLPTVTANWDIMSQAGTNGTNGTNGTDVGTVITTQGDMLYRDGSGLQRLGKGTANQTLQMNGSANAPTWVTAASGNTVKLAQYTHSSNVNNFQINNIGFDDSIYAYYRWVYHGSCSSGGAIYARWVNSSNSVISSSDYRLRGFDSYKYENNTSATINNWNSGSTPDDKMGIRTWAQDPDANALQYGEGHIFKQAGKYTMWDVTSAGTDTSGNGGWNFYYGATWEYQSTTSPVGIYIYNTSSGSNFLSGTQFTIWGIKK